MELSPGLLKIVSVLAGCAVGACAVVFFKGTDLYAPALVAAGSLFGLTFPAPGADQPVKDLTARVTEVLNTLRPPPVPPAPYEGPRGK